jgi:hypothetical protein
MYANRGMRRLMLGLAIVLLLVLAAPVASAAPGNAKDKGLPEPVELVGEVRYGAIEARTGEWAGDCSIRFGEGNTCFGVPGWVNLMDPGFNKCTATGTLTWIDKNTAKLVTSESCASPILPKGHTKTVKITNGGAVKMLKPEVSDETMWWKVPVLTGCDINGTFPVYHGHFDGEDFYASAHYNSICEGGTVWGLFGIDAEDGPIHVTYEFDLQVVD